MLCHGILVVLIHMMFCVGCFPERLIPLLALCYEVSSGRKPAMFCYKLGTEVSGSAPINLQLKKK